MNKEQLAKLAEALEQAGYKIEALDKDRERFTDTLYLEISPLSPPKAKN
jgi:hypothetical protein